MLLGVLFVVLVLICNCSGCNSELILDMYSISDGRCKVLLVLDLFLQELEFLPLCINLVVERIGYSLRSVQLNLLVEESVECTLHS